LAKYRFLIRLASFFAVFDKTGGVGEIGGDDHVGEFGAVTHCGELGEGGSVEIGVVARSIALTSTLSVRSHDISSSVRVSWACALRGIGVGHFVLREGFLFWVSTEARDVSRRALENVFGGLVFFSVARFFCV
jgi:hypothetical protein